MSQPVCCTNKIRPNCVFSIHAVRTVRVFTGHVPRKEVLFLSFLGCLRISIQSVSSYLSCLETVSSTCSLVVQTNIGLGVRTEFWGRYLFLRGRKWQGAGENHLIRNVIVCVCVCTAARFAVPTTGAAKEPGLLGCRSGNSPYHFEGF